jgi:signal transduction histidine kinase
VKTLNVTRHVAPGTVSTDRAWDRIACDLHDRLTHDLHGISCALDDLAGALSDRPELHQRLTETIHDLHTALRRIRDTPVTT